MYENIYKQIQAKILAAEQARLKELEKLPSLSQPETPLKTEKKKGEPTQAKEKTKINKPPPVKTSAISKLQNATNKLVTKAFKDVKKEEPKPEPPPPKEQPPPEVPKKQTVISKKPTPPTTIRPPSPEIKGDEPETLRQEESVKQEQEEEQDLAIIQLPRIPVLLAQTVPPIKYRNRSITFEVDFDSGKKTEYDPILEKTRSYSFESPERNLDKSSAKMASEMASLTPEIKKQTFSRRHQMLTQTSPVAMHIVAKTQSKAETLLL